MAIRHCPQATEFDARGLLARPMRSLDGSGYSQSGSGNVTLLYCYRHEQIEKQSFALEQVARKIRALSVSLHTCCFSP